MLRLCEKPLQETPTVAAEQHSIPHPTQSNSYGVGRGRDCGLQWLGPENRKMGRELSTESLVYRQSLSEFDPFAGEEEVPVFPVRTRSEEKRQNLLIPLTDSESGSEESNLEDNSMLLSGTKTQSKDEQRKTSYELQFQTLQVEKRSLELHAQRLRLLYRSHPDPISLAIYIYSDLRVCTLESGCSRAGMLSKKHPLTHSWSQRYFILRDNFIFYFKSTKREQVAHGCVRVDDCLCKLSSIKGEQVLTVEPSMNHNYKGPRKVLKMTGSYDTLLAWKGAIATAARWWTNSELVLNAAVDAAGLRKAKQ